MEKSIWAMRTSRNSEEHKEFVKSELYEKGILRQGWGYNDEQDLRKIYEKKISNFDQIDYSQHELDAWKHWRMIGNYAPDDWDSFKIGDIILVPNMPESGFFTLCKITGNYSYSEQNEIGDLRHMLPVEIITKDGVANCHECVESSLRTTLKCRSRLWNINHLDKNIDKIIALAQSGENAFLRQGRDHLARAKEAIIPEISKTINELSQTIKIKLQNALQAAEWEPVLCHALTPLMRDIEIIHTGGSNEKGADIEIRIPNPFLFSKGQFIDEHPWIIVIQVKDYSGLMGIEVADQLLEAIRSRSNEGQVIAAYILSTNAKPNEELMDYLNKLSIDYKIPISSMENEEFMQLVAKGLLLQSSSF